MISNPIRVHSRFQSPLVPVRSVEWRHEPMSVRWLLSLLLATWTLLSVVRLVFDLIGNLWVLVGFNFIQIVFLISGLFGATQKRRPLLYTLLVSNTVSLIVNVLIFLWYIGVFGEISRPWLSAGLPYSSSFFLRFTPGCDAEFDVIRKKWVQKSCLVPFYSIEASQSILHILFAVVTSVFSILVLVETRKKPERPNAQSINHYAQINASKVAKAPSSMSSAYVNSTYDDMRSQSSGSREKPVEAKKEVKGQFERNSKKKKKNARPSMPAPDCAPCSSSRSSEEDQNSEDVYTQPIKKKTYYLKRPDFEEENRVTNVTSLVSFDPKSATLLRIRQHLEAEPSDRETSPDYEGHDMYERLRSRSSGSDLAPASTIPLSSDHTYKSRNASQDSVPSMFAPMLDSPEPSSSCSGSKKSAGIQLATATPVNLVSPGIRLSDQLGTSKPPYKSAFRVQTKDHRVISHYHAPNEIPLSSDPTVPPDNYPVMTSGGLLV